MNMATVDLVLLRMQHVLDSQQLRLLKEVLTSVEPNQPAEQRADNPRILQLFLTAKEVEGCSARTIEYYRSTLEHMTAWLGKPYLHATSDELRRYLSEYEETRHTSKVTIDNIRRIMSTFFSWLEEEDYVVKSPMRKIHRIKTPTRTKDVLTDEELERLRSTCRNLRDLAIIDMLASTGMRVGELVGLDRSDINLQERECVVTGKGNKQRPVYFDARTKLHLTAYLSSRTDSSPALFVALSGTQGRLTTGSVGSRIRKIGQAAGVNHVHPHKFRRTLATHAIDKGMPIEQVQRLLGHAKIETTMHYAMVDQSNVKASHRRYLE